MMVDRGDVLWTGLYDSKSGLGRHDIATSTFTVVAAPYATPVMAVPTETSRGTVWISDHQKNKISEYDPAAGMWLQSLDMPTAAAWVVSGTEDTPSQDVYFTEYAVNKLARKSLLGPIVEIPTPPGGGPAFDVYYNGKVYFSQWSKDRLGVYDIASQTVTEFGYPVANENGGPIDVTPDGIIAVGTLNAGYIMLFDPASSSFTAYPIPTTPAGLKDGLRSDGNGNVWFTETGANKIAVLERCQAPAPPPLGNALRAVKESAGSRLRWSDAPEADSYTAASTESREFLPPLTVRGTVTTGNTGIADLSAPGPSRIRSYRVAAQRCGQSSSY